jgi:hypothetical protein
MLHGASRWGSRPKRRLDSPAQTSWMSRGSSNRQIADELVVTPGTAANHVANILDNLVGSSRIHIVIWVLSGRLPKLSVANHV